MNGLTPVRIDPSPTRTTLTMFLHPERIADQKFAVRSLVVLYRNSVDIPGRPDTLQSGTNKRATMNPSQLLKKLRQGVRAAATTTTTALGNVASEIAGRFVFFDVDVVLVFTCRIDSSVLQPNSPQAMVKTALESANKSRLVCNVVLLISERSLANGQQLARRLFYSFAKPGADYLLVEDIRRFFSDGIEADNAFSLFDKDSNGDVSREEVELACLWVIRSYRFWDVC